MTSKNRSRIQTDQSTRDRIGYEESSSGSDVEPTVANIDLPKKGSSDSLSESSHASRESNDSKIAGKTKPFVIKKMVLYMAAAFLLLAILSAVLAIFLLTDGCSVKFIETDRNVEYTLSYCGSSGDYCEVIADMTNQVELDRCDVDPDYIDEDYLGSYSYLSDYLGPTEGEVSE